MKKTVGLKIIALSAVIAAQGVKAMPFEEFCINEHMYFDTIKEQALTNCDELTNLHPQQIASCKEGVGYFFTGFFAATEALSCDDNFSGYSIKAIAESSASKACILLSISHEDCIYGLESVTQAIMKHSSP